MPRTRRPQPLYQRGEYALYAREGRNLEIIRYDRDRGRERITSAGTTDVEAGKIALDKLYLRDTGGEYQPPTNRTSPYVTAVIADYICAVGSERESGNAIIHRLAHVTDYIATLREIPRCDTVDERWIAGFRKWLGKQPVTGNKWQNRRKTPRSPATIENSILQLAAAMNWAKQIPAFKPIPLPNVTRSPSYRADVPMLAAMFRYAMKPRRQNLLAFLRLSVATWQRPDAIMDASTDPARNQWNSQARAFNFNPVGRMPTKKRRACVPVPECVGEWLDTIKGPVVPQELSKATWRRMQAELGIPFEGQGGMKLVRRSISTLARPLIGERDWIQGETYLAHRKPSTSDIYALPDPAHLGIALEVTQRLIDEINKLAPGAFYRTFTATDGNVVSIGGRKNG